MLGKIFLPWPRLHTEPDRYPENMTQPQNLTRVLVVTPDVLGKKMAGPAIRALEIAKALHPLTQVKLVSTVASSLPPQGFPVAQVTDDELRAEIDRHDVLIMQGHILASHPWISDTDIIIIADVYDPLQLEILEQSKGFTTEERIEYTVNTLEALNLQIERADFLICASEKQRDLWLGHLGALGRLNPLTYDSDPSLRTLIDTVPFGTQNTEPQRTGAGIKGHVPGIEATDKVVIWGGGIYNWFDPLTLLKAVAKLVPTHPDLKVFFLGTQHPNPNVLKMHMLSETIELAESLELTDTHVFFNTQWVEYDSRANYLLDADLGVSTHFDQTETMFSFRTRILDYIWTGLPIVATDGDSFANLIREHELGVVVAPEDVEGLAQAIEHALYTAANSEYSSNVRSLRSGMTWDSALKPLLEFCMSPRHAIDYRGPVETVREQERQHFLRRIATLEGSTSWRVTEPLRKASKWFSRGSS